jgi:hypothetical protein
VVLLLLVLWQISSISGRWCCRLTDCAVPHRPCCGSRTILVDDTPLAFLHQPENGVPVLGFRGDPDDMLLMEAVLPLVQVSFSHLPVG